MSATETHCYCTMVLAIPTGHMMSSGRAHGDLGRRCVIAPRQESHQSGATNGHQANLNMLCYFRNSSHHRSSRDARTKGASCAARHMTRYRHLVGNVGKKHARERIAMHDQTKYIRLARIATDQPMRSKIEDVAQASDCDCVRLGFEWPRSTVSASSRLGFDPSRQRRGPRLRSARARGAVRPLRT
jgi:hypothetical protein